MTVAREEPVAPRLHVVRGAPDEDELAALVAGLVAGRYTEEDPVPAEWTSRRRALRRPSAPGPDSWRWSLHP